jgi:hypothetical protein
MAYVINKFNGVQLVVLDDGTIDTTTSLGLVGRNYVGYGETQNENFVFLLENFANTAPPSRPLMGQIWFNTTNDTAYAYDGANWNPIGSAVVSALVPPNTNSGALWLKTPVNQLYVYTGTEWRFIGPEAVEGFGSTRARAGSLDNTAGDPRPVIFLETNGTVFAICTASAFVINPSNSVAGFGNALQAGINLSATSKINGNITGNAATADQLSTARLINGVPFNATTDVTVTANTTNLLKKGTFIVGADFNGSVERTWSVDATSANVIGKVVARNSEGGFSAGTVTATFVGDLTGNVTALTGTSTFNTVQATQFIGATLSGNAASATRLATARTINGVAFDGGSNVTVPASADTLTGTTINGSVTLSSLTQVGTLSSLNVNDSGIFVGSGSQLRVFMGDSGLQPTIRSLSGSLNLDCGPAGPDITLINASQALAYGADNSPAIISGDSRLTNIGFPSPLFGGFNKVYANEFKGNADTATLATTATNLPGGGLGAIPYQSSANTTVMLGLGLPGTVLTAQAGGLAWQAIAQESLTKGSYLNMINTTTSGSLSVFNGNLPATISVDATSANTASKVVARDASGNFAAGIVTANLVGAVTGNAATATQLQTARSINGVAFNGTQDITIIATDATKVALAGSTMTGYLTLVGAPVNANHATTKTYVDSRLPQYTIVSGAQYSTSGYTNQVGSFNDGANFFDVFPPAGKSMANIIAFIPSIHVIHYAGGVDGNDSIRCTYSYLGDRIRVYVQNTEQRSTPAANYLAIWS